jgi:galactose oxidase
VFRRLLRSFGFSRQAASSLAVLGAVLSLASLGCSGEPSHAGPRVDEPLPADVDLGHDAPVDLSYVCGNRFLVSNAYDVPIGLSYRVAGSSEEGEVEVAAAPPIDPAVSEQFIETETRGTVEIFLNGKPVVARANEGMPCSPAPAGPSFLVAAAAASASGQWDGPYSWPIVAVHMMLLPNGRVLSIGRVGGPQVWNPATKTFAAVPAPARLFCAGHALLSDGRVLVVGGHISDNHGLPNITYFSGTNVWSSGAPMARGRWYPTATVMGTGEVVILAGRDEAGLVVDVPEVWKNGSLRPLSNAVQKLPYYPRAFLTPTGSLYVAGERAETRFLSLSTGTWKKGPTHLFGSREYGSAVMYDDGKILVAGGGRTTNTAEIIDLNLTTPVWRQTGSLARARRHHNLTVLPTGEVLATGGVAGTTFNDLTTGVHAAELWNPSTGQWTTLASNTVTRGYHGTSLLLPDGRVLNAGSGDGNGAPDQKNYEVFSPPYLFKGTRPAISSAPTQVAYDARFRVLTPQSTAISRVTLIRLGAVTHAFDQNQRFMKLSFTADATGLTVTAPSSSNRAPPGHYMLFILNGNNVPSVAKIIRIL